MRSVNQHESLVLFLGDAALFYLSLWLTLVFRYGQDFSGVLYMTHVKPFTLLFLVWFVVFFVAGLYEKHTLILKSRLPTVILNAQIVNSAIAVLFFYLIPYFGIAPKTVLFFDLVISFGLLLLWRIYGMHLVGLRRKGSALLIGSGEEMKELRDEVNNNPRYGFSFVSSLDLNNLEATDFEEEVVRRVHREGISLIVIDLKNEKVTPILPRLYNLLFSKVKFIDQYRIYEDIFDRVPLSLVGYSWFLENISFASHLTYDLLKRAMDMAFAFAGGMLSLVVYPFVALAIKFEDGGPLFITQERVGQGNRPIHLIKFRSMKASDTGAWLVEGDSRVTRVGRILRKTRIDELPQLWNVVRGDISLIGPRPDIVGLGKTLAKEIPYYNIRYLIKPGLSGWAQIKQDLPPQSIEESKLRLAYDLFYIKNRSLFLDLKIALKTIKILLSRKGL